MGDGQNASSYVSKSQNNTIPQTERLFTTRSRSAFINPDLGGDRGTRAYIRLLTSDTTSSARRPDMPGTLTGSGNPLDQAVYGSSMSDYGGYANFLLTHVRCSLDEKMQITETFGDGEVVYYFGRQPVIFTMSGILVDSQDNNWFVEWLDMYGHVMRGSQLAKNYELLKIVLPNMDIIGTIPHMAWEQDSQNDVLINFEFQFLAKQIIPRPVTGIGRPLSNSANLINFDTADKFLSQQGINSIKAQAGAVLSAVQNPSSSVSDIAAVLTGFGGGLSGNIGPGRVSPPASTSVSEAIDDVTGSINTVTDTITDIFYGVSTNLAGIRASLFSPIYGVLTSLTKLVRNVQGDVAAIFSAVVGPVADIVRDVVNVTNQAVGLVNIINSAINSKLGLAGLSDSALRFSLGSLLNTRGVLATQPWTMTMTLRQLLHQGRLPANAGFMRNSQQASLSLSSGNAPTKVALLNSGPAPSPEIGAIL